MGLDEQLLTVHVADARPWLQRSNKTWDLILVDTYRQPSIPAHLATTEFFEQVKGHLSPGGVAGLNVLAAYEVGPIVDGLARTWLDVFPDAQVVEGPDMEGFSSRLFLAGPGLAKAPDSSIDEDMPRMLLPAWYMVKNEIKALESSTKGRVWTDNRVPVEVLTERAERRLRGG